MAKDARALREEAAEAAAQGKHKRALAAYLELERLEPRDAQWAKRAGETYRRLGNDKSAIAAFERSADRFAQNGFLVQAIAVCKLILQIDAKHESTLQRLSQMNEEVGQGPTRAQGLADHNLALHDDPNVQALRRRTKTLDPQLLAKLHGETRGMRPPSPPPPLAAKPGTPRAGGPSLPGVGPAPATATPAVTQPMWPPAQSAPPVATPPPSAASGGTAPPRPALAEGTPPPPGTDVFTARARDSSAPPPVAVPRTRAAPLTPSGMPVARTRSRPITLTPGAPLEQVELAKEVEKSYEHSSPGITVIPIDGEGDVTEPVDVGAATRDSSPIIEVDASPDAIDAEIEESTELELDDLEEIPLAEPKPISHVAQQALAATPLFAGMPAEALEALVEELTLVRLEPGQVLFHEGDVGDALYVVAEGEVSIQAEGPPRVEMARLGANTFLGEVALMTDQPRSATVTAVGPAELLRIDRHTLAKVLANHGDLLVAVLRFVRDRLVDRWVRTSPLFRPFTDGERTEVASRFKFLEINSGATLLTAGTKPDGLYIVLAGAFEVRRDNAPIGSVGPGELMAETALLSGTTLKSDVIARGKCLALYLAAREFRELIMTHPSVLEYIGEQSEASRQLQIL